LKIKGVARKLVTSQKDGGSGVLWTGHARPQHPTPRIIEKDTKIIIN
jgi:hypothetical protein